MTEGGTQSVEYEGTTYTRSGNVSPTDQTGEAIYIHQDGLDFYVTSDPLPDGEFRYQDGLLQVTNADGTFEAAAQTLSTDEVMAFYQPEIRPIMILLGLYLALIVGSSFSNTVKDTCCKSQQTASSSEFVQMHLIICPAYPFDFLIIFQRVKLYLV